MKTLTWTTAGESHGRALIGVLEGLPAGMTLDLEAVDRELARRWSGYGRGGRQKLESDRIQLISGTRAGKTLGSPISFLIENRDQTIESLPIPKNARPGHADLAGCQKFLARDPRAVLERASARETAARVALASIARQVLEHFEIRVFAHVVELGGVAARSDAFDAAGDRRVELRASSDFHCLDSAAEPAMRERVDRAKADGDSLGGVFEVRALGLPPGLGSYMSGPERLTARIGGALFSIPAIKGVEFGIGFEAARQPGSSVHDAIVLVDPNDRSRIGRFARGSNRAGGLEGGMTSGEPLIVRAAMKPIPTLRKGLATVDFASGESVAATYQRSDVTSVPAASVVGEAMVALELTRAFLEKFGADTIGEVEAGWRHWRDAVREV